MYQLTYRKGTTADREQLKALAFMAYGKYRGQLSEENWLLMEKNIDSEQNWDDLMAHIPFVCADGDRVVGMAFLYTSGHPNEIYPADWSYIRMVGIHKDYEGQGIARKLTVQCIEEARRLGEQTIALHTSELMNAARHIYESVGFREVRDLGVRFGIRYWLFKLELAD
jgi:ribosomal protein S18 acetylase RimI-like enzyme